MGALVVPLHLARAHRWVVHVLLVAAEAGEPLLLAGQGFLGRLEFPRQEVVRELVDLSELAPLPLQQEVPVLDRLLQVLLAVRGVLPAYSLPGTRSEGIRRRRKGASVNQSVSQRASERAGRAWSKPAQSGHSPGLGLFRLRSRARGRVPRERLDQLSRHLCGRSSAWGARGSVRGIRERRGQGVADSP